MSLWLQDPEKLRQDAGVKAREDVFQKLKESTSVDKLKWPELRVERKEATWNGSVYRWRYLTSPTPLGKSGLVGELNGLVGFQKDYCSDPENRWTESIHPRPFIFFHPHLPLFIDTRKEGSICRYVRRSCRANASLETYIAGETEYHFWLVSERSLAANEQITLSWDFRFPSQVRSRFMHALDLGDDDGSPHEQADLTEEEYELLSSVISGVLADYGGCACDLGNDCAFVRFLNRNLNLHTRSPHEHPNGKAKKRSRPKLHVSPSSTGHATNSRAASEGQQESYDAEDDSHSVSGSSRSKPQSRDLTPLHSVAEPNGILTEPSDREKRKLAMLEDTFKKMEQAQQPPRKKKRSSDGHNSIASATGQHQNPPKPRSKTTASKTSASHPATSAKSGVNGSKGKQYVDAATSHRQSGSPYGGISPTAGVPSPRNPPSRSASVPSGSRHTSIGPKANYVDAGTQTDVVEDDWYSPCKAPLHKRSIVSLSKRLLKNRHKIRRSLETQQQTETERRNSAENGTETSNVPPPDQIPVPPSSTMDLDPPPIKDSEPDNLAPDAAGTNSGPDPSTTSTEIQTGSADVEMAEAPAADGEKSSKPPALLSSGDSTVLDNSNADVDGPKDSEPHQPPTSAMATPSILETPVATPSIATASLVQSPFATLQPQTPVLSVGVNGISQQSPIKTTKKLSLSDYRAARLKRGDSAANKPAAEYNPMMAKPSSATIEEGKPLAVIDEPAAIDSPLAEKAADPLTVIATPNVEPATNIGPETNGDIVK